VDAQRARIKRLRDYLGSTSLPARHRDEPVSESNSRISHYQKMVERFNEGGVDSTRLYEERSDSTEELPDLEEAEYQLESLEKRYEATRKRYEALRRGPLPEEINAADAAVKVAEKQLAEAETNLAYRELKAPTGGTVLKVYRHTGDSVQAGGPTPVVCIADTTRLRIRLEVDAADKDHLWKPKEGTFSVRGGTESVGRLVVEQVIPAARRERLYDPDTSKPVDTRTVDVLCKVTSHDIDLYPGQRITAEFEAGKKNEDR
jgi:biotin carboxyl carrier protein